MYRHLLGWSKWQTMTQVVVQGTLHFLAHLPLISQYRSTYYFVQPKADIYAFMLLVLLYIL